MERGKRIRGEGFFAGSGTKRGREGPAGRLRGRSRSHTSSLTQGVSQLLRNPYGPSCANRSVLLALRPGWTHLLPCTGDTIPLKSPSLSSICMDGHAGGILVGVASSRTAHARASTRTHGRGKQISRAARDDVK